MRFDKAVKISAVAALFISGAGIANAMEGGAAASLSKVEITSTGGGYSNVDDLKITTRNAGLVKDVLRDVPGVYVGGTNGANQKIYMRGVSDRGLNITIDGAKQNGNTFHHNADLIIDPDLIKAIEVEAGARSVTSGSGALGGSVAFKTVEASDLLENGQRIGAKIRTGFASNNDEFSQGLMVYAIPVENLDVLAAANHKSYGYGKSGNDKKIGGDNGNDLSYLFKVGYRFLDAHKISASHQHTHFKGLYPMRAEFGSWHTDGNNLTSDTKYERDTTTIKYNYNPNELLNLELSGYNTKHARVSGDSERAVETQGIGAKAKSKVATGMFGHTFRYGIETYTSENSSAPTNTRPEDVKNLSLYLEDSIKVGSSGLTVIPGVRYEKHELDTFDGSGSAVRDYTYDFDKVSPAVALDYDFGRGFGAFASYAKVFKGPDVIESMYASGSNRAGQIKYKGNNSLKPTTGDSYEIGGRYKGRISDNSSVGLTVKYYRTDYENLFKDDYRVASSNTLMRINTGDATIDGVELYGTLSVSELSLSAGYTHQKVDYKNRVKSGASYLTSNFIGYRDQGDKYTFNAEYAVLDWDLVLGYSLLFFDSRNVISAGNDTDVKMPSYAVNDIYVTYSPSEGRFKGFEINAGIYNLFDRAYASHSQRVAQYTGDSTTIDWESGRNFKVNVSYKF
ncbi:MAG: TonB-dependent receptor domain-containing protein [Wolinella sp.]